MRFWPADWTSILVPQAPFAELVVRAFVIYLFLLVLLRAAGRRELGRVSLSDLLVMMLLASAARRGLVGGYRTVGDALIIAPLLLGWDWLLRYLALHIAWVPDPSGTAADHPQR